MESIIKKEHQKEKQKYPCLKLSPIGRVILFNGKDTGVVIYEPESAKMYDVGHYGDDWDEKSFTKFNGEVTLKN